MGFLPVILMGVYRCTQLKGRTHNSANSSPHPKDNGSYTSFPAIFQKKNSKSMHRSSIFSGTGTRNESSVYVYQIPNLKLISSHERAGYKRLLFCSYNKGFFFWNHPYDNNLEYEPSILVYCILFSVELSSFYVRT